MSEQDPDTPIERKKVDASAKAILEVEPTAPTVEVDQLKDALRYKIEVRFPS